MPELDLDSQITELALRAGEQIMAIYNSDALETREKSDASPVTAADLAADEIIRTGLRAAFPEIPAVTEEAADSHDQTGLNRFFLVDPLDGTKEFIQRRGEFTVNIALIEDGVPVRGVVYAPAIGRLFATRGTSAVELGVKSHRIAAGSGKGAEGRCPRQRRLDDRCLEVAPRPGNG